MFKSVLIALILLTTTACTQDKGSANDPKSRLNAYISRSFSVKKIEDRQELISYLTGSAKARLASWSDDQFREAFIDSKREFVKLLFREVKPVSDKEVNITYELTYLDQSKGKNARITNKKLCQMVLDEGKWQITDVRNLKELIEYRNEMSLP